MRGAAPPAAVPGVGRRVRPLPAAQRAVLLALAGDALLTFRPGGWVLAEVPPEAGAQPVGRALAQAVGILQARGLVMVADDARGTLVALLTDAGREAL